MARDFSSVRPSRSAGVFDELVVGVDLALRRDALAALGLLRQSSEPAAATPSPSCRDRVATMVGSSPGCQRSMLSIEPPSEALPKNRLEVLTLNGSREGAGSIWIAPREFSDRPAAAFPATARYRISAAAVAYCIAAAAARSSRPAVRDRAAPASASGAAAVLAPNTEALEVAGSSRRCGSSGRAGLGLDGLRRRDDKTIALQRADRPLESRRPGSAAEAAAPDCAAASR